MRDVSHGGSTAGYQTLLARYPDRKVSVSVLCNGTSPSAAGIARSVTDEIFGPFPAQAQPQLVQMPEEKLKKFVGIWRDTVTHQPARFTFENAVLRIDGTPVRFTSDDVLLLGNTRAKVAYGKDGRPISAEIAEDDGSVTRLVAESEWTPTPDDMKQFSGDWYSDEAQAKVAFTFEGGKAFLVNQPVINLELKPLYKDHFLAGSYVVWFTRDRIGKVERMHVGTGRMRDMFFERVK
jgi:hypothetical protein